MEKFQRNPDVVGSYVVNGKTEFYEANYSEVNRSFTVHARILRTFNFPQASTLLVIGNTQEMVQLSPFELAMQGLGYYGTNSDLSPFDSGRIESISRQFNPVAIFGIGKDSLDGLKMFGHDPEKIFAGRTIWARPDAYEAVKAMKGLDARKCALIGPAMAVECSHGGLHYDSREWELNVENGEILLSSRLPRYSKLTNLKTGFKGSLGKKPCGCGIKEFTIDLD